MNDMKQPRNAAIIVAAGFGSRMGAEMPKQFLKLEGKEILSYSVQSFSEHPAIHEVIIVTSTEFQIEVANRYPECQVVLGGKTRQDSVFNGLQACDDNTGLVLVHDAARPLVPRQVIGACLEKLERFDGVAPAITPVDSMIQMDDQNFVNLDRNALRIVQTPQCFRRQILLKAHATGMIDTDEVGLVKQAMPEATLTFIKGASETMKITRPEDVDIATIYLRSRAT